MDEVQLEAREALAAQGREQEQLRKELLRLRQLETLPERLRRSEQHLAQAQQEADAHQRRNLEHDAALAEVRLKVLEGWPGLLGVFELGLAFLGGFVLTLCPRVSGYSGSFRIWWMSPFGPLRVFFV